MVVNKEAWALLREEMGKNPDLQNLLQEETDAKRYDAESGHRLFYWESVKWDIYYNAYDPGVKGLAEVLDAINALTSHFNLPANCPEYRMLTLTEGCAEPEDSGTLTDDPFDLGWYAKLDFTGKGK